MEILEVERWHANEGDEAGGGVWASEVAPDKIWCELELQEERVSSTGSRDYRTVHRLGFADGELRLDQAGTPTFLGNASVVQFSCD